METGVRIRSGFMSALLSVSVADYFPINLKVDVVFDFFNYWDIALVSTFKYRDIELYVD